MTGLVSERFLNFSEVDMGNVVKAVIEISEETMDKLAGALELAPLYDEDYGVDEEALSNAIDIMVRLCAD